MAQNYTFQNYDGDQMAELFDKMDGLGPATQEEEGLMSSTDKEKLDGIEAGAEANVVEGVTVDGVEQTIAEKKVVIGVDAFPTAGSKKLVTSGAIKTALNNKADKPTQFNVGDGSFLAIEMSGSNTSLLLTLSEGDNTIGTVTVVIADIMADVYGKISVDSGVEFYEGSVNGFDHDVLLVRCESADVLNVGSNNANVSVVEESDVISMAPFRDFHEPYELPDGGIPESDLSEEVKDKFVKEDGDYKDMTVGASDSIRSSYPTIASFFQRKSGGGSGLAKISSLKGNSIVWNQMIQDAKIEVPAGTYVFGSYQSNLLYTNGHVYCFILDNSELVARMRVTGDENYTSTTGQKVIATYNKTTGNSGNYQIQLSGTSTKVSHLIMCDLTLMFGAGNEPSTVAEFEALYPLPYYANNPGEVLPFCAENLLTTGVNQWDEEWEQGAISSTGALITDANRIRPRNYIKVLPGMTYYFQVGTFASGGVVYIICYNQRGDTTPASRITLYGSRTFTVPANCNYIKFSFETSVGYGGSYRNDICINLSDPSINGQYVPYEAQKEMALKPLKVKSHNIWDEVSEVGDINTSTGQDTISSTRSRSKNYIPIEPSTLYYFMKVAGKVTYLFYYNENKEFISYADPFATSSAGGTFTTPATAKYMRFIWDETTYSNNICINLSSSFNGNYEPHGVLTILNWGYSAGTARNEIKGSKYIKRLSEVDMGTLSWSKNATYGNFQVAFSDGRYNGGVIMPRYNNNDVTLASLGEGQFTTKAGGGTNLLLGVKDSTYADAAAFKSAMSDVSLWYELANPIEYELEEPMNYIYHVNKYGTEQWLPANGEEPYTAPCYMDVQYPLSAESLTSDTSMKNLLEALKAANKISSYTMTFDVRTGSYQFTIS